MRMLIALAAALGAALAPARAAAQIRAASSAEAPAAPASPAAGRFGVSAGPGSVLGPASSPLSAAPVAPAAPLPAPSAFVPAPAALAPAPASVRAAAAPGGRASTVRALPSAASPAAPAAVRAAANASSPATESAPADRSERAAALVREEVAGWGEARRAESAVAASASVPRALAPSARAASAGDARPGVPAPRVPAAGPGSPALSRAALGAGSALLAAAAAAVLLPALVPAFVLSWQGALTWAGLALLVASRYYRAPGSMPDAAPEPPAKDRGYYLGTFAALWSAAKRTAAVQIVLADRVGGRSWPALRDWFLGGLRTGLYWLGVALMTMLAGAALVKIPALFVAKSAAATAAAPASGAAAGLAALPVWTFLNSFVAPALAQEAGVLALFFGVRWAARRLGAGRAAPWLAGAAALALAAVPLLALTHAPMIVASTLAIEVGVLWAAHRSDSWVSPLALRAILSFFSIEAARLVGALGAGAGGVLVGLPAVWGGVLVGALALLAWRLKSPGLRLGELGRWWRAPEPGGRPKSPWAILSAGLVWGLAVYAVGDLTYWAVNFLLPGSEPAPAILAKMLTAGVDLVIFNFVLVGIIEEYVFRRGLYSSILKRLEKWKIPATKAFWLAAVSSGLIFSGVHYVDWGVWLAKLGFASPVSAAAMAGAYAFTWAGFVARAVLGVVLAGLYRWSGVLLVPIAAHFWADTMEGLGLRWGFPAFLALAAGALLVSFLFRPKPKSS